MLPQVNRVGARRNPSPRPNQQQPQLRNSNLILTGCLLCSIVGLGTTSTLSSSQPESPGASVSDYDVLLSSRKLSHPNASSSRISSLGGTAARSATLQLPPPLTNPKPSTGIPIAYKQTYRYDHPSKPYKPNKYRLTDFPVAGVNLADYGIQEQVQVDREVPVFELWEDFSIDHLIQGDESWWDLLEYKQGLHRSSVSFYGDKVALKRWMRAMNIPSPRYHVLKYASELIIPDSKVDEAQVISNLIPARTNFVAKPTHRASASGVWVVKYNPVSGKSTVGYGGDALEDAYDKSKVVDKLAKDLHRPVGDGESWALQHVKPGLIVEDRFTDFQSDEYAATEFKAFVIWGRVFVVNWKNGLYRNGLLRRDGALVDCADKHHDSLPYWVEWDRIIQLAEELGANKDLIRVDIFAGLPAGSSTFEKEASKPVEATYVISEVAFHPTTKFKDTLIFEEGARLWLAGYRMGNYKKVPNREVPEVFKEQQMLSEEDAEKIRRGRIMAQPSSSVVFKDWI